MPAPFDIQVESFPAYGFEDRVPQGFKASSDGRLSIADDRFKSGSSCLRWDWTRPGSTLTYRHADAFKHLTGESPDPIVYEWITFTRLSTFSLWVCNETPVDSLLWFEIGDGATVDCRFWMRLDFTGWRPCQAMYGRDIQPLGGFPNQERANTLRIVSPEDTPSGTLWLDDFSPRREIDVRFVRPSRQLPWVRPLESNLDHDDFVKGRWTEEEVVQATRVRIDLPDELTSSQAAVVDRIRREALPWSDRPSPQPVGEHDLCDLRRHHAARGFVRADPAISGDVGRPSAFWQDAEGISVAYWQSAGQADVQAELLGMFNDYVDICITQGHGAGYALRTAFAHAVWLMREPLKQSGRWHPLMERLRKILSIDDFYNPDASANADVYNTLLMARLSAVLLEDDDRLVYRDLLALRHWLGRTARWGEIRPDGSLFHHNQTYSGYNLPAIGPWVDTLYLLRDTELLPPFSHLYAYRTVFAMHWYSCITDIPHTLSGRWRGTARFGWGHAQLCRKLAEMGTPEGVSGVACQVSDPVPTGMPDPIMASIYLYYAEHFGEQDEWARRFAEMGIEPATTNGHLALNHTVAAIHRRDDWMVFFRGQRHPFFSGESYAVQAGNTMGRTINYGHMAIFSNGDPTNAADSGWNPPDGSMGGWNFNFWPGTTSREIPFDALRCQFPIEEWMTRETFAVGTHLGGNGVFGMKLREDELHEVDPTRIGPVKYWLGGKEHRRRIEASMIDTSFRARKSVFCFDDRVVCLGSGIRSADPRHRVVTTLLQHHLSGERRDRLQVSVSGCQEGIFPMTTRIQDGEPFWLVDSVGNGYYLPAGHDPVEIRRQLQRLPYHSHTGEFDDGLNGRIDPNEGETELVFLDHGYSPWNGGYEYCILIRADSARMATFADSATDPATAPYHILRRDEAAHVVYDMASRTTGYVFFEPHLPYLLNSQGLGPLIRADRPCVVMAKAHDDGRLSLSICDPELGLADDGTQNGQAPHSAGTWVRVSLQGRWAASAPHDQVEVALGSGNTTVVHISCRDLIPVVLTLQRQER